MDFQVYNPSEGVWLLDETGAVTLTLIAGKDRAVLLDTGFDQGELPDLVRELTPLPVMLVHTHSHVDHTTGDRFWSEAWIHPADLDELRRQPWGADMTLHTLEDGETIDLGGRVLEVIHLPGHTPGSIVLLDRNSRALFAGDAIMAGTVPINKYPASAADFAASMDRIYDRRGEFDVIYPAHRAWPLTHRDLADLRDCAHKALEGTEEMTEFSLSIITPDRTELDLRRRGYEQGRTSVTMEILNFPGKK